MAARRMVVEAKYAENRKRPFFPITRPSLSHAHFAETDGKKQAPPWFEHGTLRSAIVCSTTEL